MGFQRNSNASLRALNRVSIDWKGFGTQGHEKKRPMKKIKNIISLSLTVVIFSLSSCQQSLVTDSGLFEKESRVLEESLIGAWALVNDSLEYQVVYEFVKGDNRKVKLLVRGEEIEMTEFRSNGGDQFSFEYLEDDFKVLVVAQFKSYDRKTLLCIQEPGDALQSSKSMIVLDKVMADEAQ
jgi:hypothetical protein